MESQTDQRAQAEWQRRLTQGHKGLALLRFLFRSLPSSPRCKECYVPFGGIGGKIGRMTGWGPSRKNPNLCHQ